MDSAAAILRAFAAQWSSPSYPPVKVDQAELQDSGINLGVQFPEDYKAAILSVGLPSPTLALLSKIVERKINLYALAELSTPTEIVEETLGWREIGLPKNLIVIGNDSMGSKFCFDVTDLIGDTVASAAVYFWDHDFGTVELVAASFPEWIGSYVGQWSTGLNYNDF